MKNKAILFIMCGVLLTFVSNSHAEYIEYCEGHWTTCSSGNTNIEKCGREWGWTDHFRCKEGFYYKTGYEPNSCTSSCFECPNGGTSDPNDNEGITSCYQKPGTYSDNTGIYTVTADCYYTE